jgi:hypothetical protein
MEAMCSSETSVTANVASISPIIVTLIMEAIRSSETSVLTRATRRHIPDGCILQGQLHFPEEIYFLIHKRKNLKHYRKR